MPNRRACLFAGAATLLGIAHAHESRPSGRIAATERARRMIVFEGEAALAAGDASTASELFERAGNMAHEADAELGLVRAMMQAGQYRHALGFAAHVAGVHPEESAGAALYAWLLHLGGQTAAATSTLQGAFARAPDDRLLLSVRDLLALPSPVPPAGLLVPPARFAPASPRSAMLPVLAKPVASGVVFNEGRMAMTMAGVLGSATIAWVRDGLGRVAAARVEQAAPDAGIAVLHFETPLGTSDQALPLATRDPFSGSPGFAIGYPVAGVASEAAPAWPLLRIGFLGAPGGEAGTLALGITIPAGLRGGAVFDSTGALAGMATGNASGGYRITLASRLRGLLPLAEQERALSARPRMGPDEIYERAMPRVVQILIAP